MIRMMMQRLPGRQIDLGIFGQESGLSGLAYKLMLKPVLRTCRSCEYGGIAKENIFCCSYDTLRKNGYVLEKLHCFTDFSLEFIT